MIKMGKWISRRKFLRSGVVLTMLTTVMIVSLLHSHGLVGGPGDEGRVAGRMKHLPEKGLRTGVREDDGLEDAPGNDVDVGHRRVPRRRSRGGGRGRGGGVAAGGGGIGGGGVVMGMQRKLEQQESPAYSVGGDAGERGEEHIPQKGMDYSNSEERKRIAEDDAERILALRRQEDDEDEGYPGYYDLTERRELEERMEKKRERVRKRKKQFGNIVPQDHGDDAKQMKREEIKPKKSKGAQPMKYQADVELPGANGKPVQIPSELQSEADDLFIINSFNLMASDMIGINRSLPDVRPKQCLYKQYSSALPNTSVIIVFHNEAWSALLRTVHSVINRTPRQYLSEIILVDDASIHAHLGHQLDSYVAKLPVPVHVERMGVRSGLIRARMRGALVAQGQVLTFLDSHCEASHGWLEPLLARIAEDRSNVVTPVIDVINAQNLAYEADNQTPAIGVFDWSLTFRWQSIQRRDLPLLKHDPTHPIPSPTMAGGLFAIDRSYFIETGMYDSGFEIWGAENLEISFKTWMCGGRIEILPCSHVGHIFRKHAPYSNTLTDFISYNNKRLAEVWLDGYKEFFYFMYPSAIKVNAGNYTDRVELRDRLGCRSFQWYLENVFPEGGWPGRNKLYGEVRHTATNWCLDTGGRTTPITEPMVAHRCDNNVNQIWMYTEEQEIKHSSLCLDYDVTTMTLTLMGCHQMGGNQLWDYVSETGEIKNRARDCLDLEVDDDDDSFTLTVQECDGRTSQRSWQLNMKEWDFKKHSR
ncbi:polypeptide N-acetylgalactosaminyltransferase 13 [Strongylocentrotus purpuratus]|uniref:Polypeptide N-acetylgalactosaminyltransferase n=1 Tax=Strongylocentrotus purpuratus TaxID=7668 RepID=A0A7M7P3Q5_STRPU|nr:polypeptide N-acetylgalactosaminyltransferase 13 [Strongylocentrotus purpuratus]